MKDLVIRIRFRTGGVAEERGTEEDCYALFAQDEKEELLDYVIALKPETGEYALFTHENDHRYDGIEL